MKRRIVITSNTSWFIYNFFCSSITEFMQDGNEIFIVAPRDKYASLLEALGCRFHEVSIDRSGANFFSEWKTITTIYKTLKQLSPDCVLNFTPKLNIYSVTACKILKIPVINSVAGLGYIISSNGFKSRLGKLLLRLTQPLADHIIFQNGDDLSVYLENKWANAEKISRVRGIGVNLQRFTPQITSDDGTVRFLLFARMLKSKGVPEFVEAARMVLEHYNKKCVDVSTRPKVEFSLLGFIDAYNPDGIPREVIEKWHSEAVVRYLGETDNVIEFVRDYDCVVLPSFYREGIPQCLIEAAAMAKPIITTDHVGCRETVVDGLSGYLVPPRDSASLAKSMIKMADLSHSQRLEMGRTARLKAENEFCHLYVARHYMTCIESVLSVEERNDLIKQKA
uniref:glycosyltransferase family 4 protein n=1 Tax=Thaumasiovibrio occultus TaxID=1891184 RepID=UPI000B3517BA|nr:glycosyltransferase family 4 protein [Thaumasiovibrio occultus]